MSLQIGFENFKDEFLHVLLLLQLHADFKTANPYYDNVFKFWTRYLNKLGEKKRFQLKLHLLEGFFEVTCLLIFYIRSYPYFLLLSMQIIQMKSCDLEFVKVYLQLSIVRQTLLKHCQKIWLNTLEKLCWKESR